MAADENPVLSKLQQDASAGRKIVRVVPDKGARADRQVVFHYSDEKSETIQTESSHETFIAWWKQASMYWEIMCSVEGLDAAIE